MLTSRCHPSQIVALHTQYVESSTSHLIEVNSLLCLLQLSTSRSGHLWSVYRRELCDILVLLVKLDWLCMLVTNLCSGRNKQTNDPALTGLLWRHQSGYFAELFVFLRWRAQSWLVMIAKKTVILWKIFRTELSKMRYNSKHTRLFANDVYYCCVMHRMRSF